MELLSNSESVKVLDAGFSTQVSLHLNTPIDGDVLWSARLIHTNPEAVIQTHYDFIEGKTYLREAYIFSVSNFLKLLEVIKNINAEI